MPAFLLWPATPTRFTVIKLTGGAPVRLVPKQNKNSLDKIETGEAHERHYMDSSTRLRGHQVREV